MLEQFKLAYEIHPRLRRAVWGTLLVGGIFFLWISGGFPPRAWRLLADVIPRVSQLWAVRGPVILLPLALLALQSLAWVIVWGVLLGGCVAVIRHWRQRECERQQFDAALRVAHDAVTEEQEVVPVDHAQSPLVLSGLPQGAQHAASQYWQRELLSRLESGVGWDAGTKRKDKPNEDSLIAFEGRCIYNGQLVPFGLFVVADGMGGYAHGQDASCLAIQSVLRSVLPGIAGSKEMSDDALIKTLVEGIQQANLAVCQRSQETNAEMGTTITAALMMETKAFVVNVGDSRTYLYRECDGLSQVTQDHSHVARLVAAHQIAADDVYTHPDRNQVYRALGAEKRVEVDEFIVPLQMDDCLLLCSDGLWEMVRNPEIAKILQQHGCNPSEASEALVGAALKAGGLDNISVIVIRIAPLMV